MGVPYTVRFSGLLRQLKSNNSPLPITIDKLSLRKTSLPCVLNTFHLALTLAAYWLLGGTRQRKQIIRMPLGSIGPHTAKRGLAFDAAACMMPEDGLRSLRKQLK